MTSNNSNDPGRGQAVPGHETLVLSLFDLDRLPEDRWPVKHAKPVAPPPPATESMHKRRQVAEQQRAEGRGLSTEDAIEQLSSYMSPSCPFEFQLRRDAVVAATENANNVTRTAARLFAMGYRVVVRSVRDTSVPWSTPAVNSFIVCSNREDGSDVEYIIDLQFKEFFRTAYMSATYKSLWHTLPAIFAGISYRLAGAVQLLSEEVELSFLEEGRPIPPWRSSSVAIRRWLSTHHTDHPPPPAGATPSPPQTSPWDSLTSGGSPPFIPPVSVPPPGPIPPSAAPPLRRRSPLSSLTSGLLANLQTPEARSATGQPPAQQHPKAAPASHGCAPASASSSNASSPNAIRTFPLAPRLPTPTSTPPSTFPLAPRLPTPTSTPPSTSTTPHPIPPRPPSSRPRPTPPSSSVSSPSSSVAPNPSPQPSPAHPDAPGSTSSLRPTPSPRHSRLPASRSHTPRSSRDCPSPSSPYQSRGPCRSPSSTSTSCSPLRSPPASTLEPNTMSTPAPALPPAGAAGPPPRIPQPAPVNCAPPTVPSPPPDAPPQDVPTSKSIQDFISFLAHINNQPVPPPAHHNPHHAPSLSRTPHHHPSPTPPATAPNHPTTHPPPPPASAPPASAPPATSTHLKPESLPPARHSKSHPVSATYLTASSATSSLVAPSIATPIPVPAPATTISSHPPHPHHPHGARPAADATTSMPTTVMAAGALGPSSSTTAAIPIPGARKSQKMRSLLADAFGRWR